MNREDIITSIKNRIESEHRKHPDLDWTRIAAGKIYSQHFEMTSVNDKLPKADQIVLCYGMGKRWFTALYQMDTFLIFNDDLEFEEAEYVTHWKALPEYPEI